MRLRHTHACTFGIAPGQRRLHQPQHLNGKGSLTEFRGRAPENRQHSRAVLLWRTFSDCEITSGLVSDANSAPLRLPGQPAHFHFAQMANDGRFATLLYCNPQYVYINCDIMQQKIHCLSEFARRRAYARLEGLEGSIPGVLPAALDCCQMRSAPEP